LTLYKKIRQLLNQSVIYGIGTIFERLLGFILLPIFVHLLPREDYGIYTLWIAYLATIEIFYMLGMNSAIIRFYADSEYSEQRKTIFSTAFLSVFALGMLLSTIIFIDARLLTDILFNPQTNEIPIKIMAGVLLINALDMIALNTLKAESRALSFLWVSISSGLVLLGLTLYFLIILQLGLAGALLSVLLAACFKFVLLFFVVILRRLNFRLSIDFFKGMLRFGLPFLPTVLAVALMGTIDRYLLQKIAGIEVVGIYGAGYRLAMVIGLLNKTFQYAWEPFIISTYQQPHAREVFARVFTYFLLVMIFVFLFFTLFIDQIVRFQIGSTTLFTADYFQSTEVVPTLMLAFVIYGCYLNFIGGVYIRKKSYYFIIITGGGLLVNFIANMILIPLMGMQGAAWATVLAYAVMTLWLFLVNQRFYKISYEYVRIAKLVVIAGAILFVSRIVNLGSWNAGFDLLLLLVFPIALFAVGFFDTGEISRFREILKGM